MSLGDYRLEVSRGFGQIVQRSSGETMHARLAPLTEAHLLYVQGSGLGGWDSQKPCIVWDVGLGGGANASAWFLALQKSQRARSQFQSQLVSFEIDLDPLRLVIQHPEYHPDYPLEELDRLLKKGAIHCESIGLDWKLIAGDFAQTVWSIAEHEDLPNWVWYDPFSQKVDHQLWSAEFFERLFGVLIARSKRSPNSIVPKSLGSWWVTYAHSTLIRARLLAAGAWVAEVDVPGLLHPGTLAWVGVTPPEAANEILPTTAKWLDERFAQRMTRSGSRPQMELEGIFERAISHPQFARIPSPR
jgi:hypothetical protein